jgi:hypothetical protein
VRFGRTSRDRADSVTFNKSAIDLDESNRQLEWRKLQNCSFCSGQAGFPRCELNPVAPTVNNCTKVCCQYCWANRHCVAELRDLRDLRDR